MTSNALVSAERLIMDNFHSIQIREDRTGDAGWVTIDGMELRGVMSIDVRLSDGESPRVIIEIIPRNLDMDGEIVVHNGQTLGGR